MLKSYNLFSFFLVFSSLQGCAAALRKAVSERYCLYVCILIVLLLILFVIFSLSFLLFFIGQFFLGHPQLYGPNEALVKTYVEFQCEVPNHPINHEILLQIFKWVHSI